MKDVADIRGNESENSSIFVGKWLKKPLIELTARCGSENTLAEKIKSYHHTLFKILKLPYLPKNLKNVNIYPVAYNLWKNLFQVVFFEVENCLDEGDVYLSEKEKMHVIATIFREIVDRLSYGKNFYYIFLLTYLCGLFIYWQNYYTISQKQRSPWGVQWAIPPPPQEID